MKKKSDKVSIVLWIILAIGVLSWIIPQGAYGYGVYGTVDTVRAGIFDYFVQLCFAIYYNYIDILFILIVGGCYGVLSKTKSYRKLVDKTAKFIKGKESYAMMVTTFVISLFTSLSDQLLSMFIFVPFIVSVFLRNGKDRLTAISASFGGILVGFVGATFGMYAYDYINESTGLAINSLIGVKFIVYFASLILFNVFAILHMKKSKKVDDTEFDLFLAEELDEKKVKAKDKTKVWPLLVVFGIIFVLVILGQINWKSSFNVTLFSDAFNKFKDLFKIADVPLLSSLLGYQFTAFGEWENLIVVTFLFLLGTVIISLSEKMKFKDFTLRFDVGVKKLLRLAIIYGLIQTVYVMTVTFQWVPTVINKLLGSGSFSILLILIVSFVASVFYVNPGYSNYIYGYYLSTATGERLADAAVLWHLGQAFAAIIGPTSLVVLLALTYLDVPYKKWLKYIWKFALSLFGIILILMLVKVYM